MYYLSCGTLLELLELRVDLEIQLKRKS